MRAPLLLLGGIVVLSVAVARALSCVCSPLECDVLTEEDCPGGLTWDPCRCCKVCARVEGEPCGGLFGFSGSCAVGLQCVIKNLLHHTREVDEGVCEKIPGRWRRHCPHGPIMSGSGCNLVGEGASSSETGNAPATGKCVCGPSVPWCPGEPRPYVYMTRHECNLNLVAKMAYDVLFNSEDNPNADVDALSTSTVLRNGSESTWPDNRKNDKDVLRGTQCPEDSVANEDGSCKCRPTCPSSNECRPGQRQVQVRPGNPKTPGDCCPRYECISAGSHGGDCPEDSVPTEDGHCKCVPTCSTPTCTSGRRPVEVRAGVLERPGSCCPLYDCVPSEAVSWVDTEDASVPGNYCIYEGVSRKLGERWQPSPCVNCICKENGHVSCQMPMCKSCENSIPPGPGECCPHCPPLSNTTIPELDKPCRDSLIDCNLKCEEYVNDENNCLTCECVKQKKHGNDAEDEEDETICPELPHCDLNCELAKDEGGCSVCACQQTPTRPSKEFSNDTDALAENGSRKKVCPEVKCDLHCERGLVMDENDCTFCECKAPHAGCPPVVGCKKKCAFGYKTNKRGCPVCRCRASCTDHFNETHPEGSTWHPNTCTTCTCEAGGRLNCKETFCSIPCSNPLPPKSGTCCPYCPISAPGWGTVPITLIVVLTLLCLLLIVHIVRNRFRGRLSPSDATYASYPPQYYKCVPAYDTPVHRNEKIVPL